jgi:hypothetical protein
MGVSLDLLMHLGTQLHMGDLPILTTGAAEIASQTAQREKAAPRVKVKQGFDFRWRHLLSTDPTIDEGE